LARNDVTHHDSKFQKRKITPKYKGEPQEFEVWVRPISEWAEEMLQDEDLIHHFVWDAEHVSKFDSGSGSWVRVVDEPWTADRFWEIQVGLVWCLMTIDSHPLLDRPTRGCKAPHILYICRQDKTLLIWYPKGLSSDCTMYKSSCQALEWGWDWGRAHCWMVTNCELVMILPTTSLLMVYNQG